MGMFDDVLVDYVLPHPEIQGRSFQTKSLDQCLDVYKIDQDGKFYKYLNNKTGERIFLKNFSEEIEIHEYVEEHDNITYPTWYEYDVTFFKGVVTEFKISEFMMNEFKRRKDKINDNN